MKLRKMNRLFSGTLAGGLLVSTLLAPAVYAAPSTGSTVTSAQASAILESLTPEQRQALEQLSVSAGFTISPDVDTNSKELVNIIVQFNPEPAAVAALTGASAARTFSLVSAEEQVEQSHQDFKAFVNKLQSNRSALTYNASQISIDREYRDAFNGVAMTLPGIAVQDLAQSGLVKRIWNDAKVELPQDTIVPTDLAADDTPIDETAGEAAAGINPLMMDSVPYIGVDKLQSEGITGEGIKVGVLDTGIDYNHPDLTGVYKGYRKTEAENPADVDPASVKGWDFIDNDADPMETTYDDWVAAGKPESESEYFTAHGTHVSGTIAGQQVNDVDYAVNGVAPGVELYSYRVLGPYGSGANSGIIAAIDKAVQDGMDVINLSLGSQLNDPLDPTSIAINNAMLAGVVSVIAAGNDGPKAGTLGTPGASALGITIGASSVPLTIPSVTVSVYDAAFPVSEGEEPAVVTETVYQPLTMKLFGEDFNYEPGSIVGSEMEIVYAGLGKDEDFKGLNVAGKVALIVRGDIGLNTKIKNAAKAGAAAAIIYNNTTGYIDNYLGEAAGFIPTFQILQAEGESLKQMDKPYISFTAADDELSAGDKLADFSSRGPVSGTDDIKPDLVAPGVAVFSTYPVYMNDPVNQNNYDIAYTRMSGTSMATPHVAGIAALILQANPEYTPFDVKAALMNTSVDLNKDYSVYEVGAGRVDAYRAVHAETAVKVLDTTTSVSADNQYVDIADITGSLNFGSVYTEEGETAEASKTLELDNRGKNAKTYHLELELPATAPIALNSDEITVPAESSTTFNAELLVNDKVPNGTYEGYIHVINAADAADRYQLPLIIRVSDEGIGYFEMDPPAISNNYVRHTYSNWVTTAFFGLKSPMEMMDFYLKDYSTGEVLGYLGALDASGLEVGKDLYLFNIFKGYVYPFTKDGGISDVARFVNEGAYTIEVLSRDADGALYHQSSPMTLVDNTAPELSLTTKNAAGDTSSVTPSVIEVDDSLFTTETYEGKEVSAIWVHGNITDSSIKALQEAGYSYDQGANTVTYYEYGSPFMAGYLEADKDGNFRYGITKAEFAQEAYELRLFGWDIATVGTPWLGNKFAYLTPDTTYALTELDRESVEVGDTFTATINMNNLKAFTGAEFTLQDITGGFKLESMEVTDEFKALAAKQGAAVDVQRDVMNEFYSSVKVNLQGEDLAGIDGDVPFLTLKYKVGSDAYYNKLANVQVSDLYVTRTGAEEPVYTPAYNLDYMDFVSHTSRLYGYVGPEAFMVNGEYLQFGKDYSKMNFKVYAETESGEKYTVTPDKNAYYDLRSIPVTDEVIKVTFKAPGHTSISRASTVYTIENGKTIGAQQQLSLNGSLAGDVNGDEMIDINDLKQAGFAYLTSDLKSDINQDGIVDDTDIAFIVKNFLALGGNAALDAVPQDKIAGVGLDEMLEQIKNGTLVDGGNGGGTDDGGGTDNGGGTDDGSGTDDGDGTDNGGGTDNGSGTDDGEGTDNGGGTDNGSGTGNGSTGGGTSGSNTAAAVTEQTVSASDLAAGTNGVVTVDGKVSVPVKLPASTGELLKGNSLAVRTDAGAVTIPAEVLQALTAQANDNNQGNIYLTIASKTVTPASAEAGVALSSGGTYDFSLSYKKADGEVVQLAAFPKDVQLTLSYSSSLNADLAGIYYLNDKTSAWEYAGGKVNPDEHTVTTNVGHFSTYGVLAYDKSFTDLAPSHWAAGAVKALSAKHIVTGPSETLFAPNAKTTRAEFVAMIVRALELDTPADPAGHFSDVSAEAWYADEVTAANAAGLVNGITETIFAPNQSITREEMAVIAVKAYEFATAKQAEAAANTAEYKDQSSISSWAKESIGEAAGLGIMSGHTSGLFAPKAAASRVETVQTLYNLLTVAGQ